MNIHCRKYRENDLETLQGLMLELGYSTEKNELKNSIEKIHHNGGEVLIAEKNHSIAGSVSVLIDARLAEGVYAEIVSLIVSENARGKGIGKMLVKEAESWASQRVNKIRVRANETRSSAHNFYKNQGYNLTKTQKIFIKKV